MLLIFRPAILALGGAAYGLLKIISLVRPIRLGLLRSERIGHLALNTEIYLRTRASDPSRRGEMGVFLSAAPCNKQLLAMIRDKAFVIESRWAVGLYNHALLPWLEGTALIEPLAYTGHDFEPFKKARRQLEFNAAEENRGKELLREIGINPETPFVCFSVRDKAYLDMKHGYRRDWSHHNWRDCSLENYLAAAEMLADQGYMVLRMGSVVEKPLPSVNPRIIDYAIKHRSDFGDVYLAARCRFFLGSESGLTSVPGCFDVPVASANLAIIGYPPLGASDIFIVKKYRDSASGRLISYREIIARGADLWLQSAKFEKAGITLEENSSIEVLELAKEMAARVARTWVPAPGDEELQARFRSLLPANHPITGFPSRLGAHFLRTNAALLE